MTRHKNENPKNRNQEQTDSIKEEVNQAPHNACLAMYLKPWGDQNQEITHQKETTAVSARNTKPEGPNTWKSRNKSNCKTRTTHSRAWDG